MTLPATGPISLAQIAAEFLDTGSNALNEFYAGGGKVQLWATADGIPVVGAISAGAFRGLSREWETSVSTSASTLTSYTTNYNTYWETDLWYGTWVEYSRITWKLTYWSLCDFYSKPQPCTVNYYTYWDQWEATWYGVRVTQRSTGHTTQKSTTTSWNTLKITGNYT